MVISYVGYQTKVFDLDIKRNQRLDIELDYGMELQEFVVSAESMRRVSQLAQMSVISLPVIQAQNIPALLGEKDMLKVLQLLPGVQSGTEGTSGFFVRGESPDQNLIILDDATVYNAHHLFGFFSVFNGDAIKNMQLYKGDFPARFGGRLSSVLDIQMKDGNKQKLAGEGGIGIISSRLTLEGPLVKDKASFLVSGRRTYVDLLMKPFLRASSEPNEKIGAGVFFYDFNAKVNHDISQKSRLFISTYFGHDKFYFEVDKRDYGDRFHLLWGNQTATARLATIFSEKLFGSGAIIFSKYQMEVGSFNRFNNNIWELKYNTGIRDIGAKYDLTLNPHPNHFLRTGIQVIHHHITPRAIIQKEGGPATRPVVFKELENTLESAAYVENEISIGDFVRINPGLRFTHFVADSTTCQNLEPRISANILFSPVFSFKTSFASMNQYLHLLSSTGIGLPTDLWVGSTRRIKPQRTWQVEAGLAYDWLDKSFEVTLEGYYKKMRDIISYKEGASFIEFQDPAFSQNFNWQDQITAGTGEAYGVELLLHRKKGRLSGWVGYTLA